jgi:hypothetical protein
MRYKVVYLKPKKKKGHYTEQAVTFYSIEDAVYYEENMTRLGCKNFKIIPL